MSSSQIRNSRTTACGNFQGSFVNCYFFILLDVDKISCLCRKNKGGLVHSIYSTIERKHFHGHFLCLLLLMPVLSIDSFVALYHRKYTHVGARTAPRLSNCVRDLVARTPPARRRRSYDSADKSSER